VKAPLLMLLMATAAWAETDAKTERTFKAKCSACHGKDGKAQTEKGRKMKIEDMTTPEFKKKPDAELRKAINEGVDKGDKLMDPYKDELTPEQVESLIKFIRSL